MKSGFKNCNYVIKKKVTSWDKAMYILCHHFKNCKFCWIVEDDVFIPSVKSVLDMTHKYSKYDLVTSSNYINYWENKKEQEYEILWEKRPWIHWSKVPKSFNTLKGPKGWARSMVCAMGISGKMIDQVCTYVKKFGTLEFLEFFFNTLAYKNHLKIYNPIELSKIFYRKNFHDEDILDKFPKYWIHPIKDQERQSLLRSIIEN